MFAVSMEHRFRKASRLLRLCPPRLLVSHGAQRSPLWRILTKAQGTPRTNLSSKAEGL